MVKFSRELEAQLIPEWKDAFVNYRQLKKHVKKIKLSFLQSAPTCDGSALSFGFSILDPIRAIAARNGCQSDLLPEGDETKLQDAELVESKEDEVNEFFEKLEEELTKVNNFYRTKEAEFCERGEILTKQLRILLDLKKILHDHHRRRQNRLSSSPARKGTPGDSNDSGIFSGLSSVSSFSENGVEDPSPVADELLSALERNGVTFVGSARYKAKKGGKPKTSTMRIDIPATTATKTITAVTSMIWEDLVNGPRKDGSGGGDYINRKKIQCAEKIIRGAFVDLYKGLGLLKRYSSLNMVAFTKILKKFNKVTNRRESESYLQKVKRSHFISSDKIVKLADEVESNFTKHFASNDKRKAMKFLRPQQPKESHVISFLVGLFTGSFVTLFSVYAILAHSRRIFSSSTEVGYMETVYPVFSMFALLSLHIFLYGCNLFLWRTARINHNFIFEFSPNTALKHKDAFLICTSIMTAVVGAMVVHLMRPRSSWDVTQEGGLPVDPLPGVLLLLFMIIVVCPFNVFYRSTRYCFLRVIRNILFSPFYKVLMVDFFMADQLTSQIPLLRHMEFTACYFVASAPSPMQKSSTHRTPYETCIHSQQYKVLAYVISFLPYYCRAMQCARRYIEEDYDIKHLANAGKYVSAMLAAAARWKYAVDPTPLWLAAVILSSTLATCYQLYWDFVQDWGLFNLKSKNPWLRDDLILKNKSTYYISIALNFVLRLAWIESVMSIKSGPIQHRLIDFLLASLEIIRRGHWNFYRLENEHLNNAGKFRAVKTVPVPFREMDSDG